MPTFSFKTNINCGGCIEKVKPYLDELEGVQDWDVDTQDQNKVLTIQATEQTDRSTVEAAVKAAGFEIKPQKSGLWSKLFG